MTSQVRKGIAREKGASLQKQNEEPEVAYEEDIPSDGIDKQSEAEIEKLPVKLELTPKPDHLKN